jgi:hypothetical protein
MNLRTRLNDRTFALRAGLTALLLASLARWFLRPSASLTPSLVDTVTGLLYGVAIALMLRAVWLNRRGR